MEQQQMTHEDHNQCIEDLMAKKLKTVDDLKQICEDLHRQKRSIVWTNGVFDILHAGHVTYLLKAASLGDFLVVGMNSDQSVQEIKGPDRPIVNEQERALVLCALESVDYVTIFSDENPVPILKTLQPDVYAKGGDYTIDTIVQEERRLVEAYGGQISIIPGVDGLSTTNIIEKIAKSLQ